MSLHVIVGAGPVGTKTALLLAERGDQVRVLTRSGSGPEHPGVERVAMDASDADALARRCVGATAIYNCANPPYNRWLVDWPPLASSMLSAAKASGAGLVHVGNLYAYGAVDGVMTEALPLRSAGAKGQVRARMWGDALAAHRAGEVRAAEVRGSDYVGAGAQGMFTVSALPRLLAGKRAFLPAALDAPHSWTYIGDVARTLVAVADSETAWGRPWHVPTAPPISMRELCERTCAIAGVPAARVSSMPEFVLWLGGLADPIVRELRETQYQFRAPFVIDSSAAAKEFGIEPHPLDDAIAEMIAAPRVTK
ncbi:MAG TPA: NAD-dependent epimerase/dehydratase family protein [Actinospica sp.]|jgi:nucleoside-diphosphate-sugar epimerase|nr:NAD-dependent epimerase/dehydratase family protein [Actinospica sp.]